MRNVQSVPMSIFEPDESQAAIAAWFWCRVDLKTNRKSKLMTKCFVLRHCRDEHLSSDRSLRRVRCGNNEVNDRCYEFYSDRRDNKAVVLRWWSSPLPLPLSPLRLEHFRCSTSNFHLDSVRRPVEVRLKTFKMKRKFFLIFVSLPIGVVGRFSTFVMILKMRKMNWFCFLFLKSNSRNEINIETNILHKEKKNKKRKIKISTKSLVLRMTSNCVNAVNWSQNLEN